MCGVSGWIGDIGWESTRGMGPAPGCEELDTQIKGQQVTGESYDAILIAGTNKGQEKRRHAS